MPPYMVFDVESVGLHGEGFAFGYVVVDEHGTTLAESAAGCDPKAAHGTAGDLAWVRENVTAPTNCATVREVRDEFWRAWMTWKKMGATLAADCLWPVEAAFLEACVQDDHGPRNWDGPYPFIDVASVRLAAGLDPLGTEDRRPEELPAHHPLRDARQSARLLVEALTRAAVPA